MSRETEKTVDVMGRKFKIKKFDAFTGSYIMFQMMEKVLPMALEAKVPVETGQGAVGTLQNELPANRMHMSRQEFETLQRDCLSVVSEVLPAGPRPVLNPNGTWGLNDVEHNTMLVLLLTIHALAFNVGDFFAAGGLSAFKESLAGILPANTKI